MIYKNEAMFKSIAKWDGKYKDSTYTVFGDVWLIDGFFIPQLGHTNHVWIYLPPDYHESEKHYPVLYFLDGQTAFGKCNDQNGELIDKTINDLFNAGKTEGIIVVGIESSPEYRRQEYNPIRVPPTGISSKTDEFAGFVVDTLKPFIDENYRTWPEREYTGIAGGSAGAACSVYTGLKYQEVFSKIGAFMFTLIQSFCFLPEEIKSMLAKRYPMKIYMNVGGKEREGVPQEIKECFVLDVVEGIKYFYNQLLGMGFGENELRLFIDKEGRHSRADAAKNFPDAFLWLYEC